jgi:hypothetical protein
VQIELAHLVDPAIGALLTERGYRLPSLENVLGLALDGEPERVIPPGVQVRPGGDDEFEPWLERRGEWRRPSRSLPAATAPAPFC